VLIECPKCFSRVLPMTDHRCPSCQRDTRAAKVAELSSVRLRAGASLPDVCIHCGNFAANRVDFRDKVSSGGVNILIRAVVMLFSPIWYALLDREMRGESRDVAFRLPICSLCVQRKRTITPQYVNFEHHTLTLLVHSEFAAALAEQDVNEEGE
jgi:hypothetical protein